MERVALKGVLIAPAGADIAGAPHAAASGMWGLVIEN